MKDIFTQAIAIDKRKISKLSDSELGVMIAEYRVEEMRIKKILQALRSEQEKRVYG